MGGLNIALRGPRFWYNKYFIQGVPKKFHLLLVIVAVSESFFRTPCSYNISSKCSGPKGCPTMGPATFHKPLDNCVNRNKA